MDDLATNPFAAIIEPGLAAQAVAHSAQLNVLTRRRYAPLDQPSRAGGPACAGVAAFDHDVERGAAVEAAASTGWTLSGHWHDGVDGSDRLDFVDTDPGALVKTDPVQRFG